METRLSSFVFRSHTECFFFEPVKYNGDEKKRQTRFFSKSCFSQSRSLAAVSLFLFHLPSVSNLCKKGMGVETEITRGR